MCLPTLPAVISCCYEYKLIDLLFAVSSVPCRAYM